MGAVFLRQWPSALCNLVVNQKSSHTVWLTVISEQLSLVKVNTWSLFRWASWDGEQLMSKIGRQGGGKLEFRCALICGIRLASELHTQTGCTYSVH